MEIPTFHLITILLAASNFILGILIFSKGSNKFDNIIFFLLTTLVAIWILGLTIFTLASTRFTALLAAHIYYAAAAGIPIGLLYFSFIFPGKKLTFARIRETSISIVGVVMLGISLWPGILFKEARIIEGGNEVILRASYSIYAIYFLVFGFWAFSNLFHRYRQSRSIERKQIRLVLIGIGASFVFGVFFNLILPWIGTYRFILVGPYFTVIMIVLFGYAIAKHGLMNVRLIATELFTALILFILLADMLFSQSLSEFLFKSLVFLMVLIFGILLIRGTLREIRELERLSKAKSDFVSIVSHQLRTPLTAIKGFVSMIQEGSGSEESRKDWLNKTYTTNERMIQLVDDILNISRIERGKLQYTFTDTNIIDLIEGVISETRIQAEEKGLVLNWEKPTADVPLIRADEGKLRQVILNLVDNAIHYTNTGHINVRLAYLPALNRVKITVQDTGIGMAKEDLANLFDQFSRGRGGQKINVEGLGLGLYVAHSIVGAHKGKIWAESEGMHKGSRFYVELPVQ